MKKDDKESILIVLSIFCYALCGAALGTLATLLDVPYQYTGLVAVAGISYLVGDALRKKTSGG